MDFVVIIVIHINIVIVNTKKLIFIRSIIEIILFNIKYFLLVVGSVGGWSVARLVGRTVAQLVARLISCSFN
jgi:hypothetical protein